MLDEDFEIHVNPDRVPQNLNEAVDLIKEGMPYKTVEFVKNSDASVAHFGLGMSLRNGWSLWDEETVLVKWFKKEYDVDHADDISGIILDCVWRDIKGIPRRDKEQAEQTKKYWEALKKAEADGSTISLKVNDDGTIEILPKDEEP